MCKWVSNTHWVYERQKMQVVPNEPVISPGYLIIWIASHRKYLTQICWKLMWWGCWKYIPKHFAFAISSAFAFWMKFVEKRGYLMMTDPLCSLLPLKMWLADYGWIVNTSRPLLLRSRLCARGWKYKKNTYVYKYRSIHMCIHIHTNTN